MAKALKTIGMIAGAVALAATGIGAIAGAAFAATAIGGAIATIGTIASLVSGVAMIGAQALTKPPPARGSVSEIIIEVDPPSPYVMGEGPFAGVKRHHAGYGATLKKVPNPYLWEVMALCVAGPIAGPIVPWFDFAPVDSFYNDFFDHDSKLGATPDTALTAPYGAPTGWTSDHKLSGVACIGWNHKFDKDGKRYANGMPNRVAHAKWVRVYDPRLDSTRPGGSGSHRLGDEDTYEWSENPALHAGTYAYGRYQDSGSGPKRVFGMGLPEQAIDWAAIAAWAEDCDANEWRIFGVVFEGAGITPGQRWANLRDICIAGGGEPLPLYTGIGFHWDRPRVVLDTITEADIAGEIDATGMQSFRDRINTIVPEFINPDDNWERVKAAPIVGSSYLAEDGEPNTTVFPFNFVKDAAQAGQLAAYRLANGRELYPIMLDLMPRMRAYRPGDCLQLVSPQAGLDTPVVMVTRSVDATTGGIRAVFIGETAAKHAYALGETATPPPTPALGQSAQERDELAWAAKGGADRASQAIASSYTVGLAGNITLTDNADGTWDVGIPAHTRSYRGVFPDNDIDAQVVTIAESTSVILSYDDDTLEDAAPTILVVVSGVDPTADAYTSEANPYRHFLATVTVPAMGGGGGSSGGGSPGGGGWNGTPGYEVP